MPEITDPNLLAKLNAGQPKPVLTVPDTRADAKDARDEISTDLAIESNARGARGEDREIDKTAFSQKDALGTRYNNEPAVKSYRVAVQQLSQALRTGDGPQSDLALTYAFAKAMDPDSVVRESEQGMVTNSQPWFQSAVENAKKQFGMDGAGAYTPEARKAIRAQIASSVAERNRLYRSRRDYYSELARRNSFDPFEVVGDHDGKPYLDVFTDYDRKNQIGRFAPGQVNRPDMTGGLPTGTDATFADQDGGGFDRGAYLRSLGIDPNQEASVMAFYNANRGNENLTAEEVLKFYADLGARAPDPATILQQVSDARAGKAFGPIDTSQAEAEYRARVSQAADTYGLVTGESDYGERFQSGATMGLQDELAGVGGGISALLQGENPADAYRFQRDVQRERYRQADENTGLTGDLVEIGSSMLVPFGAATTPMRAAKIGAMSGAVGGFGYGEGAKDSLGQAALLATGGAGLGYGLSKVAEGAGAFKDKLFPGKTSNEAADFVEATANQNIDYLPADIPGATGTKILTGVAKQTLGGPLITRGADKATDSVEGAVSRAVDGLGGAAADNTGAGQAIQRGVKQWQTDAGKKVDDLYQKIPIPDDTAVQPSETVAALRGINNPTSSNAALSAQLADKTLLKYQEALESGSLSWADLKKFRSYIGEKSGRPTFQQDISKDSLDALYGALSRDIEAAALSHSPDALKAFKRANNYKRGVETRREEVFKMLLGKDLNLSPEKTFDQIQRWSSEKGGDFAKASQAIRSLPEDEANYVRATILDGLGTASKGSQNAKGDAFSINNLVSNWNGLSDRAKAVLFQGDHRKAVDDIMTAASGMKASARYNNSSNTGATVVGTATLSSFYGGILPGIATVVGQTGLGAILGSPRVAKWMSALYRKPNPQAAKAHVMRLSNIAKSEPYIGAEIINLKDYLLKQLAESPQRAAAQDQTASLPQSANTNTEGEGR